MNRKDIALSVAGVLATMALAYLFYRQERAAVAAPPAQDVQDASYYGDDANTAYLYEGAGSSSIPSISVPNYSASVDTSASTGTQTPTDDNDLLSQIIAAYHGDSTSDPVDFSSLGIPAATVTPGITVSNIPQTAADALANANNMLGVSGVSGGAVNPPSTTPPAVTTGQNLPATSIHFNHIVNPAAQ